MAGKIANGSELAKQSWSALRAHPQLLKIPFISGAIFIIVSIILTVIIGGTELLAFGVRTTGGDDSTVAVAIGILTFVLYFVGSFITYYSKAALVGAVLRLIQGKEVTTGEAFGIARKKTGKIATYAAIAATIGVIAKRARENARENGGIGAIIGAIVASLVQGAWDVMVFFAIPIIVAEDVGTIESMKRSIELFRQTWGESFVGSTLISGVSCLVTLAVILVCGAIIVFGVVSQSVAFVVVGVILLIISIAIISLVNGAVNGVLQASLYHYAKTGDAGPFIENSYAEAAFA